MLDFICRNLDAIIISTTFFLLGFIPSMFSKANLKNQYVTYNNNEFKNNNIENTYTNNFTCQIQNKYTVKSTVALSKTQNLQNSKGIFTVVLSLVFIVLLIHFFYYFSIIHIIYICCIVAGLFFSGYLAYTLHKLEKILNLPVSCYSVQDLLPGSLL